MEIINVKETEFIKVQENFRSSNFLQSNQIFEIQRERGKFQLVERLLFIKDEKIVGLAVINYRRKWKIFTEALLVQGPVLNYSKSDIAKEVFLALEKHVALNKAINLMCHPYLINHRRDELLKTKTTDENIETDKLLKQLGFKHSFDADYLLDGINQAFIKDLSSYGNYQDIEKNFSAPLKRNIKKYRQSHVKVRELTYDEIPIFYDILVQTSGRKTFTVQDIDFFKRLKIKFQDRAKFMLAYLDCAAYQSYLEENIAYFSEEIALQQTKADSKKRNMAIKNAEQQLTSYLKRLEEFKHYHINEPFLPLSSYLFIEYADELISYFGGNLEEYFVFGGATLINCEMMQYAKDSKITYFNFGGTIETDQSQLGQGNFNYKKQFGGELVHYLGTYKKALNLIGKLAMIKESHNKN
ncbi:peptidoglycan bridge formation glycyltransferase FemA/FemB family protein [Streptococcus catagoni]|uniref:peptidoglycan bridge formation glycyltransferase FemA/FemB family protein n=1 Tax=Streptococcus catagoni TaxID=2654874 RepID=UPI00140CE843|nr:peptidoglycan bridge formation glycyltransferase FemA/FemB family protein [Streptococcus catagoni]